MRFRFIFNLLFDISHRNKTRNSFLLQKITNNLLVSVKSANYRPNLFFFMHFLPFL